MKELRTREELMCTATAQPGFVVLGKAHETSPPELVPQPAIALAGGLA